MPHILEPTCVLLLLAFSFNGALLAAQSVKPSQAVGVKPSSAAPARNGAEKDSVEKKLTPEQLNALAVLDGLFAAAKRFDDEAARIKTRAQIADVLWAYDEARARRELEESFRSIEKMKLAPKAQAANEPSMTAMMSEMFGFSPRIQLRSEVLRLIAGHDAALSERLAKTIVEDAPDAKAKDSPFGNPGERSMLYLQIALSLLETNPTRAAEFAKLSLQGNGINLLFPGVLFGLRAKDQKLGDSLFSNALAAAQRDPARALLNISMLAPYVFPDYGGTASSMQMIGTLNPQFDMASL